MTTIASNSTITYSAGSGIMNNGVSVSAWPITISAGVTVTFGSNLTLNASNQYFNVDGSGVTINGSGYIVTINGVTNYTGLLSQPSSSNTNIVIKNMGISTTGSASLSDNAGFVVANNSYNVSATSCYSTGAISGTSCGGIFGSYDTSCNAISCYSTGAISGTSCGGIFGSYDSSCNATSCYSTGVISNTNSGGIYGSNSTRCNSLHCYSLGNITNTTAGGIFGSLSTTCSAINCYSYGSLSNTNNGIYGDSNNGSTRSQCYSANFNWSDTAATAAGLAVTYSAATVYATSANGSIQLPWKLSAIAAATQLRTIYITNYSLSSLTWPFTINTADYVVFLENLIITTASQYFTIGKNNVTIDGLYNNVLVKDVINFSGLCINTSNYKDITIQNFGVIATGTTTLSGGWICQPNFGGTNNYVKNCYSTGNIGGGGGICGYGCAIHCVNCYSNGDMNGIGGGGIYAYGCSGNATNCYSTGNMTQIWCGGIYSRSCSGNATNCYSTGNMTAGGCGGIYSWGATGNATNCYASGNITTNSCGGIYSWNCSGTATNCYSTGNVSGGSSNGGICSYNCSTNINNCYSTGTISGGSGDMVGYSYTGIIKNSYSQTNYYG